MPRSDAGRNVRAALAFVVVTWIGLFAARTGLDAARATGWLFVRLPAALPAIITPADVRTADRAAIGSAWAPLAWVVIVVVAVSMLNGALLELETGIDERVDHDLVAVGAGNVLVALVGGLGSQVVLPTSPAAHKLAPGSRVPGSMVAAAALLAALGSAAALPYLPRPVFAAIIAFHGDAVAIVRLQGHLFFGSAAAIDATLQPLVDRHARPAAIVLDFTIVGGVDVSAALSFAKFARRARVRAVKLCFAGLSAANECELRGNGALGSDESTFGTLGAALEAQEDHLLARARATEPPAAIAMRKRRRLSRRRCGPTSTTSRSPTATPPTLCTCSPRAGSRSAATVCGCERCCPARWRARWDSSPTRRAAPTWTRSAARSSSGSRARTLRGSNAKRPCCSRYYSARSSGCKRIACGRLTPRRWPSTSKR